jgi:hypothetical protein
MKAKLLFSVLAVFLLSSCASQNLTVEKPTFAKDKDDQGKVIKKNRTRFVASDFR